MMYFSRRTSARQRGSGPKYSDFGWFHPVLLDDIFPGLVLGILIFVLRAEVESSPNGQLFQEGFELKLGV
jgi:hypothetical protein